MGRMRKYLEAGMKRGLYSRGAGEGLGSNKIGGEGFVNSIHIQLSNIFESVSGHG